MEKVIIIFTIIILISIFAFIGIYIYNYIDYGKKEGTIVDKSYQASYTTVRYTTVSSGGTTTSIPVSQYYPESFNIKIQTDVRRPPHPPESSCDTSGAGRIIISCKINAPQTVVKYPIVAIFHTVKSITVITYRYTMPEEKAA